MKALLLPGVVALAGTLIFFGPAQADPDITMAVTFRSCAALADQRGYSTEADLFRDALDALGASENGQTIRLLWAQCLGMTGSAELIITSQPGARG
jgi:hypothetical protein